MVVRKCTKFILDVDLIQIKIKTSPHRPEKGGRSNNNEKLHQSEQMHQTCQFRVLQLRITISK